MDLRPLWKPAPGRILPVALVLLVSLAGSALAKPWTTLAPSPLASDSSYAALSALPADSLDTNQFGWVAMQRDWRAQRLSEEVGSFRGIASTGFAHIARAGDARFAKLASKPYAEVTDGERTWLIVENAAQRSDRANPPGNTAGVVVFSALLGATVALAILGVLVHDTFDHFPFGR
jgi:hypothetical protein